LYIKTIIIKTAFLLFIGEWIIMVFGWSFQLFQRSFFPGIKKQKADSDSAFLAFIYKNIFHKPG